MNELELEVAALRGGYPADDAVRIAEDVGRRHLTDEDVQVLYGIRTGHARNKVSRLPKSVAGVG